MPQISHDKPPPDTCQNVSGGGISKRTNLRLTIQSQFDKFRTCTGCFSYQISAAVKF